jgi:hypothetical protein
MICLPPECGGLELFKFDKFLGSQQCSWILKGHKVTIGGVTFFQGHLAIALVLAAEGLIRCFILYCMVWVALLENLGSAMTVLLKTI